MLSGCYKSTGTMSENEDHSEFPTLLLKTRIAPTLYGLPYARATHDAWYTCTAAIDARSGRGVQSYEYTSLHAAAAHPDFPGTAKIVPYNVGAEARHGTPAARGTLK